MNWLFHLDWQWWQGNRAKKLFPQNQTKSNQNKETKKENKQNLSCLNKYQKKKKSLQSKVASYHW